MVGEDTHMPRIGRLYFADGHTEEVVIDDPRTPRICHDHRYFRKAEEAVDELPAYLEEPTVDRPGAVLPTKTGQPKQASTRPFGDETLVPGPGGHNPPDW